MFSNLIYYVIFVLGSDSAKKYCPTHIFPFLAPTPCLTNFGKRPNNNEFSENFRNHDGRGKLLKVMKARANRIICSGMMDKYL
jgi:hypothetical protein